MAKKIVAQPDEFPPAEDPLFYAESNFEQALFNFEAIDKLTSKLISTSTPDNAHLLTAVRALAQTGAHECTANAHVMAALRALAQVGAQEGGAA
jgi:hypothetical protein